MLRSRICFGLAVLLVGLLSGCAKTVLEEGRTPPWVNDGSGSFTRQQDRFFQALGTAGGVQNRMLLRVTADNAARDKLLVLLENYSERLLRSAAGGSLSEEEISEQAALLARINLRQAVIGDHWQEADGRLVASCRLELSVFKENLARYKALDADLRNAMLEKADDVHDEMGASS
ncbi:MAG: hypothetical protein P8X55_11365 [Desulfosarcinaceae bacterium]